MKCDGIDNNCNDIIDEDVMTTYYQDLDGDGFGDPDNTEDACSTPDGYSLTGTDCDDDEGLAFPGAVESCDDIDNNCDGEIDEGVGILFFSDLDNDGYGDEEAPILSCQIRPGLAEFLVIAMIAIQPFTQKHLKFVMKLTMIAMQN